MRVTLSFSHHGEQSPSLSAICLVFEELVLYYCRRCASSSVASTYTRLVCCRRCRRCLPKHSVNTFFSSDSRRHVHVMQTALLLSGIELGHKLIESFTGATNLLRSTTGGYQAAVAGVCEPNIVYMYRKHAFSKQSFHHCRRRQSDMLFFFNQSITIICLGQY